MEEQIESVLNYITAHLAPKNAERHKYGEVFTPLGLVDEMLSRLPAAVWTDAGAKWLDPASGLGTFLIKALIGQKEGPHKYVGLFEGLRRKIPDDKARCKHIVEKMLFMIDINANNNAAARTLIRKLCPSAQPNVAQIDRKNGFLVDKALTFNGKVVRDFDIIVGNPPFNKGTILRKQTRKIKKNIEALGLQDVSHESLWTQFIVHIFTKGLLKAGGYLLFITPINWFHPEVSGARDQMLARQIDFVRIFSLYDSMKHFGGKGKLATAYYLIQNKASSGPTTIIDIENNKEQMRLNKDSILILAYNGLYNKVRRRCPLFRDTDTIHSTTTSGCNKKGDNKNIVGIYNDGTIKYVTTDEVHPLAAVPKIFINGYTYPRYYYDKKGEYGKYPKDGTNFMVVGDKLNKVADYFDTRLAALLLKYTKFTQEKIEPKYFPDVRGLDLKVVSDKSLADYFHFTEAERSAIRATDYPAQKYKFELVDC